MPGVEIYLSYAPSDRVVGQRFADALRSAGASVSVDPDQPAPAQANQDNLRAIAACDTYIVLLSKQAINSNRLRALGLLYTAQLQDDATKRIIPVLLEPLTPGEIWPFLAPFRTVRDAHAVPTQLEPLIALTASEIGLSVPGATEPAVALLEQLATHPRVAATHPTSRNVLLIITATGLVVLIGVGLFFFLPRASRSMQKVALIPPQSTPTTAPSVLQQSTARPMATATIAPTATVPLSLPTPTTPPAVSISIPTPVPTDTANPPTPVPTPTPTATPSPTPTPTPSPTATPLPLINFPQGFSPASAVHFNGNALLNGTVVRLTAGNGNEQGSMYFNQPVPIAQFTTQFQFQLSQATADGITFVMQNAGLTALEAGGNNLGYGGMLNSVAIKFDLWDPNGNVPIDTTGLFTNGAPPMQPDAALPPTIDLHSGHPMLVKIVYQSGTLDVTMTDTTTNATAQQTYPIDIAATIGASQAYVGFTGATGGLTAIQDIQNWVWTH